MAIIEERKKFLLGIIHLSGHLEGVTRIQKMMFLAPTFVKAIKKRDYYDDWVAGKYGPYSPTLSKDIKQLVEDKTIIGHSIPNEYGYTVVRYALSDSGQKIAISFVSDNTSIFDKLKFMINKYAKAPLMSVLHDVYYMNPEYISRSEIKGKVTIQDSELSEEYDYPSE